MNTMKHFSKKILQADSYGPVFMYATHRELACAPRHIIRMTEPVNPELLQYKKEGCEVYDSAKMTLEEVLGMLDARGLCNGIMQKSDEEPLKYTREDHYPLQYNKEEGVTIDHSAAKMCS